MSEHIGWHHPVDGSDQWDGFNDPGIETFAGSPMRSLAREVNQNALDAGEADLVDVRIKLHQVETKSIPNLDELIRNMEACYEASINESSKAKIFFETALAELKKSKIKVLEISDFNTTGMMGPSMNGTPFYAFMKAKGQSRKAMDTAVPTGSYGIGKFAPYSASNLRTIFVSTVFQDKSGECHQYTQGKSILMSHDIGDERKVAVGFWGVKEKCQPYEGVSSDLPEWLRRVGSEKEMPSMKGSKLSILCFDDVKNWREFLAVSVANNFFGSINDGKLKVDVDGEYTLDKGGIREFFESSSIREIIVKQKDKDELDRFDYSKNYLAALQEKIEVFEESSEMYELGHCKIKILIGEGLPRKVCILRNGMFITDSLNRLKSFSDFKEFVAVVECQSTKGNELLRAMEPPKHDDFEPNRLPTKKEREKGARALRDLAKWVRDMLKRHAKDPVSEKTEIDELKEFFGDEGVDGAGHGEEEINPYGEVLIRAKPIKMNLQSAKRTGDGAEGGEGDGGDGGGGDGGSGGGDGSGGKGSGKGGTGGGAQKPLVDVNNVRAITSGTRTRKVAFTPVKSGTIVVRVMEAGADTDYEIAVVKSDVGSIDSGNVVINATAGSRISMDIELNQDFSGAIKVVAHEV